MAAPSYAQSALDHRIHLPYSPQRPDSDADVSSIADISTTAYSDTDDSESPAVASLDRRKRDFLSSIKSKLQSRPNDNSSPYSPSTPRTDLRTSQIVTSPTPSSPQRGSTYSLSDPDLAGSGHSRAGSIYSLSRVSFTSRLAQLTSIPLPTASSLQARISSQPTAHLAARTLSEAGDQIRLWTKKAGDVLQDLDAQDDVEWSAAGGCDGLEEVDHAIARFEGLVKVYVISIEELQMRSDVKTLSDETLKGHVDQMECVVMDWQKVKQSLKSVKDQVEIALEWEELWNTVIGEIAQELGSLSDLIFEMEEKRHLAVNTIGGAENGRNVDLDELSDVVERRSSAENTPIKSQVSLPPPFSPNSPIEVPSAPANKDDSKLLALFARMQPLRASLDFLPMRLSTFHNRGNGLFPSGCVELETRRDQLEAQWKKLEADAEALRKELGEDRWLMVFRNAGRQALKMFESVERSLHKLNQAVGNGTYQSDPQAFSRMAESYEAKKTHYVPAIDRVLGLIDRGVMDRLSVNGEILRLQSDMKRRYKDLIACIKDMDDMMDRGLPDVPGHHLRDSISTILSSERSMASSTLDSPRSSPASSVMMRSRNSSVNGQSTPTGRSSSALPKARRTSNLAPATPSTRSRSRMSDAHRIATSPLPRPSEPYTGKKIDIFREFKDPNNKPRWNAGGSVKTTPARDFPPLSATEPSPYRKPLAIPRKYTPSRIPGIPELGRTSSPVPSTPTSTRRLSSSRLPPRSKSALEHRSVSSSAALPSPSSRPTPKPRTSSSGRLQPPSTPLTSRKYSTASTLATVQDEDDSTTPSSLPRPSSRLQVSRPPSSMSTATNATRTSATGAEQGRRTSVVGTVNGRRSSLAATTTTPGRRTSSLLSPPGVWSRGGGRDSRTGVRAASAMAGRNGNDSGEGERPRWKY
ncbi:hypothetical protein C1H76_6258 [Elsinoe australis]|uniref:Karyogamy protein n=1 Tax=Elsinoe australis TaxID=40998 RepID=A0A4U7AY09_9PEZI|nr:hypothetical protein C1H76_6258 [Elsinoe australis]